MKKILLFFLLCSLSFNLFAQTLSEKYSYDELLNNLYKSNPDILMAQEEYYRSILDVKDAKAARGPVIDMQISGTYMLNPTIGPIKLNVAEVASALGYSDSVSPQYITLYDGMENTYYDIGLTMTQPIFTWGKINNAVRIYNEVSKIKEIQLSSTKKQLEIELKTRLTSLSFLYSILEILEEEKGYAQRLISYSEDAEASGMLLHQDVLEARIQAKELDIASSNLYEEVKKQLLELSHITGIENLSWDQIDFVYDESEINQILNMNRSELEQKAISGNQDSVKMLTLLQNVNEYTTAVAKSSVNWKPDFALQLSADYAGSRVPLLEPNWLKKDSFNVNISVGVKTTVWDGGKKLNDVSRKISEQKTTEVTYSDTITSIRQTLASQWNTVDICNLRMEYQDLKIETIMSKISQNEVTFQTGYGSESDLLSARIDLCNERINKEQQALNRCVACYTILYLSL